jgi:hypothetical protein
VPVVMMLELPGVTTDQYDQLNELMGIRSVEDEPEGLISHVCAVVDGGLFICDVWRSQEEFEEFAGSQVGPAMQQLGATPGPPPRFAQLHHQVGTR